MPTSNADAAWEGGLKNGKGHFHASSGAFDGNYSAGTRFGGEKGTNPEELLAAAHASCLSMAIAAGLDAAGTPATRISTSAACTNEKVGDGFAVTRMRLTVRGQVPGIDQAQFKQAAEAAKNGCPISKALKNNLEIELDAALE